MRSIPVIELCHGGDRCTGGGIAINDIDLLHGVQLESFAEQRIQKQKYNVHSNGDAHGIKQPGADLRCILDLKGVQNDTGHDQIDKDHRQHLTVRCLQQVSFHNGISHQQDQEQLRDLLHQ